MPSPRRHQGGVVIFYWDSPVFAVEAIRKFGANIIACQMATGERLWYIVGCYLLSGDGKKIRDVEAAVAENPRGIELIVAGDLNVDLGKAGGRGRDEKIVAAVATVVLEDLAGHFFLQRQAWYRHQRMWETVR